MRNRLLIQVSANRRKSALFALIAETVGKRTGALITLAGPVIAECYTMKGAATSVQGRIAVRLRRRSTTSPLLDCQAAFQSIAKHCAHLIQHSRRPAIAGDPEAIHVRRIELIVPQFLPRCKPWASLLDDETWRSRIPRGRRTVPWAISATSSG